MAWLALQLAVLGAGMADIHNHIIQKDYHCAGNGYVNPTAAFFLPLIAITPNTKELNDYCHY